MAVFRAAEDAAPDAVVLVVVRIPVAHCNGDAGVVHVGEGLVSVSSTAAVALAAAEDVAVGAVQGDGDTVARAGHRVRTDLAAGDVHRGQARVGHGNRFAVRGRGRLAHAAHLAAAIHVEVYMAALDVDGGVFRHPAILLGVHGSAALAAAKHMAANKMIDIIVFHMVDSVESTIVIGIDILHLTHFAVVDVHCGAAVHLAFLAAAVDIADDKDMTIGWPVVVYIVVRNIVRHRGGIVADIDHGIGLHRGVATFRAAKHIASDARDIRV